MDHSWMEPITSERNPLRYAGYVYDSTYEGWTGDFYPAASGKMLEIRLGWLGDLL